MKKALYISLFLSGFFSSAQNGTSVYPFMNIPVSARQAALGGDAISIRDSDVSFTIANPSLLNKDSHNQISLNAAMYLADSQYGTIAYARDLDNGHMVSINGRYLNYGKITRTDESGFEMGEFSAADVAIGAGYAFQFEENWTIGGGINFITSKIDTYSSSAISGSAGITYHHKKNKEAASIVFKNFGYQFQSFNGTREDLPFRVDLGYTKIIKNFPVAVTITAHDLQKFNISSDLDVNGQEIGIGRKIADHFSIGAELFPERNFNIRLGYNVKRGNELAVLDQRSFAGISGGFGFKLSRFTLDYAHARYHNSASVNQIGISVDLNSRRGE